MVLLEQGSRWLSSADATDVVRLSSRGSTKVIAASSKPLASSAHRLFMTRPPLDVSSVNRFVRSTCPPLTSDRLVQKRYKPGAAKRASRIGRFETATELISGPSRTDLSRALSSRLG